MMRSRVDLPQPEGPISATNSPRSIVRSMSCNAMTEPRFAVNVLFTPCSSTAGGTG